MAYLSLVSSFGFADMPPQVMLPMYAQLGCRGSQFYRNTAEPLMLSDARRLAESCGLGFHSMHGVFGPDIDPSSPHEAVRSRVADVYTAEARVAQQIGAGAIVVHPAPASSQDDRDTDARRQALVRSMHELSEIGQRAGVWMLLENVPPSYAFGSSCAVLADLIRELDLPRIAMCYDTGHACMSGDPLEQLHRCRDVVRCVHVHDNDGRRDSHALPGDGAINWQRLGPALSGLPDGVPLALEIFPAPEELQRRLEEGYAATVANWFQR